MPSMRRFIIWLIWLQFRRRNKSGWPICGSDPVLQTRRVGHSDAPGAQLRTMGTPCNGAAMEGRLQGGRASRGTPRQCGSWARAGVQRDGIDTGLTRCDENEGIHGLSAGFIPADDLKWMKMAEKMKILGREGDGGCGIDHLGGGGGAGGDNLPAAQGRPTRGNAWREEETA